MALLQWLLLGLHSCIVGAAQLLHRGCVLSQSAVPACRYLYIYATLCYAMLRKVSALDGVVRGVVAAHLTVQSQLALVHQSCCFVGQQMEVSSTALNP